jgi:hypothetical protein
LHCCNQSIRAVVPKRDGATVVGDPRGRELVETEQLRERLPDDFDCRCTAERNIELPW